MNMIDWLASKKKRRIVIGVTLLLLLSPFLKKGMQFLLLLGFLLSLNLGYLGFWNDEDLYVYDISLGDRSETLLSRTNETFSCKFKGTYSFDVDVDVSFDDWVAEGKKPVDIKLIHFVLKTEQGEIIPFCFQYPRGGAFCINKETRKKPLVMSYTLEGEDISLVKKIYVSYVVY